MFLCMFRWDMRESLSLNDFPFHFCLWRLNDGRWLSDWWPTSLRMFRFSGCMPQGTEAQTDSTVALKILCNITTFRIQYDDDKTTIILKLHYISLFILFSSTLFILFKFPKSIIFFFLAFSLKMAQPINIYYNYILWGKYSSFYIILLYPRKIRISFFVYQNNKFKL